MLHSSIKGKKNLFTFLLLLNKGESMSRMTMSLMSNIDSESDRVNFKSECDLSQARG